MLGNACSCRERLSPIQGTLGKFMSTRFKSIHVSGLKYTGELAGNWIAVDQKDIAAKILNLESVIFDLYDG